MSLDVLNSCPVNQRAPKLVVHSPTGPWTRVFKYRLKGQIDTESGKTTHGGRSLHLGVVAPQDRVPWLSLSIGEEVCCFTQVAS